MPSSIDLDGQETGCVIYFLPGKRRFDLTQKDLVKDLLNVCVFVSL